MSSFNHDTIDIAQCFRPQDIVRARVISEQVGGKESSTLLTTADENLGVVFARSESSGLIMVPRDFARSQCPLTGAREKRKNANPMGDWLETRKEVDEPMID